MKAGEKKTRTKMNKMTIKIKKFFRNESLLSEFNTLREAIDAPPSTNVNGVRFDDMCYYEVVFYEDGKEVGLVQLSSKGDLLEHFCTLSMGAKFSKEELEGCISFTPEKLGRMTKLYYQRGCSDWREKDEDLKKEGEK